MNIETLDPSTQYKELAKEAEKNITELGLGEYTLEEQNLLKAIETLKLIKAKYTPIQVATYVKLLKGSATLQGLSNDFKRETLKELRKMKLVQEIVEFDWVF